LFIAIDPNAFGATEHAERTAEYALELKRSRKSKPTNEIVIPGERSQNKREKYMRDGIPLLVSVWENTKKIAQDLGVQPPTIG
jgi:LDH2 family malate/lactate/ureidoglycolate dehydrogenase